MYSKWVKRTFLIFSQEPGAAELSQETACVANFSVDASSFLLNFMWLNTNQVPGEKNQKKKTFCNLEIFTYDDPCR